MEPELAITFLALSGLIMNGLIPSHLAPIQTEPIAPMSEEFPSDYTVTTHPQDDKINLTKDVHHPFHITCKAPHEGSQLQAGWTAYPTDPDRDGLVTAFSTPLDPTLISTWNVGFDTPGEHRVEVACYDAHTNWYAKHAWTVHVEPDNNVGV